LFSLDKTKQVNTTKLSRRYNWWTSKIWFKIQSKFTH